jgi:flavin reductase (DIM6/NTAB) family NADH-FMN oxidoreductase RutF
MAESELSVLSNFWAPLCAVGSHGPYGPNAQICISVFGASIVPDRPRMMVLLWKGNYTCELVQACGTLAVTVLSERQLLDLFEPLGMKSGRDGNKLSGLDFDLTDAGDPIFRGGVGSLDCRVLETQDLGDAMSFLCEVTKHHRDESAGQPMTWAKARERIPEPLMERYREKNKHDQDVSRGRMVWRA